MANLRLLLRPPRLLWVRVLLLQWWVVGEGVPPLVQRCWPCVDEGLRVAPQACCLPLVVVGGGCGRHPHRLRARGRLSGRRPVRIGPRRLWDCAPAASLLGVGWPCWLPACGGVFPMGLLSSPTVGVGDIGRLVRRPKLLRLAGRSVELGARSLC